MRRLIFLLAILILALVACTDNATPNPPELSQFFESAMADGAKVSVNYPADWGIQVTVPDFGIAFTFPADLASTIGGSSPTFEEGQIQVFVIFSPKSDLAPVLENLTAQGLLESFLANVDSSSAGEIGEIESRTLGGREAATVLLSESSGDTYSIVIDAGDAFTVVTGTFASGKLNQYQATIEAIAISSTYSAIVTEATAEATEPPE